MDNTCDRCGVYTGERGHRVGLLLRHALVLDVNLCTRCLSIAREQIEAAVSKRTIGADVSLERLHR